MSSAPCVMLMMIDSAPPSNVCSRMTFASADERLDRLPFREMAVGDPAR